MSDIIVYGLDSSLDTLRSILAMSMFIVLTPILIFGYMGVIPESLAPEIFMGVIAVSVGYFTIDILIYKHLSSNGFKFQDNLNRNKLLK